MGCRVCGSQSQSAFSARVMGKYDVSYFLCPQCGFLQTEEPYWLEEAYGKSINLSDTGTLARALQLAGTVAVILYFFFDRTGRFLDFAGGYGLFVRRMRDIGFDFRWYDKYTANLVSAGWEDHDPDARFEVVTSFETFEHFADPVREVSQLAARTDSILFTTEPLPETVPAPMEWHYYGLSHGQHISFFSRRTLRHLADGLGMQYYGFGTLHIFTRKRLPARLLGLALFLRRYGLFRYVSRVMRSLTVADSTYLSGITGNQTAGEP